MGSKGSCKAPDCEKEVRAKQYCAGHYRKWRRGEMPKPRYKSCNKEACLRPMNRRGLCDEHYAEAFEKKAAEAAAAAGGDGAAAEQAAAE